MEPIFRSEVDKRKEEYGHATTYEARLGRWYVVISQYEGHEIEHTLTLLDALYEQDMAEL